MVKGLRSKPISLSVWGSGSRVRGGERLKTQGTYSLSRDIFEVVSPLSGRIKIIAV